MKRLTRGREFSSIRLWAFAGYLALVFLIGGGARGDILSLIVLRPIAVLTCGVAAVTLRWEHIRQNRFLFLLAAALFILVGLHLVPLPPDIWHRLPGRDLIVQIDASANIDQAWRPLSIAPLTTWNALFSLFIPLAALLMAVQLNEEDRRKLLAVIISLGLISGLLGLLQVVGSPEGPLYLYRITNNGSAVGLFANRNHQAMMLACLIPLLAVYASKRRSAFGQPDSGIRRHLALACGIVLVPLLLVTGSRAGLALGVMGIISIPFLYRGSDREHAPGKPNKSAALALIFGGIGVASLVVVTILYGRAEAFTRIMSPDPLADARFSFWGPILDLAWKYFPFGSGVGTFVEAYQIDEPQLLLSPNYLNHAHNDWLEVFVTSGLAGVLLLGVAVIAWLRASFYAWRGFLEKGRGPNYGRLGSFLLLMIALASLSDYPLRVPSFGCLAVVFAVWLGSAIGSGTRPSSTKSIGISDGSPVGGANEL